MSLTAIPTEVVNTLVIPSPIAKSPGPGTPLVTPKVFPNPLINPLPNLFPIPSVSTPSRPLMNPSKFSLPKSELIACFILPVFEVKIFSPRFAPI